MKIGATVSLRIHLIDINYCCEKLVTPIDNNIEFLNISNNGMVDKWRNEVTCGLSIEYYLRMSIVLNFPQLEIKANACQGFSSNVCGLIKKMRILKLIKIDSKLHYRKLEITSILDTIHHILWKKSINRFLTPKNKHIVSILPEV